MHKLSDVIQEFFIALIDWDKLGRPESILESERFIEAKLKIDIEFNNYKIRVETEISKAEARAKEHADYEVDALQSDVDDALSALKVLKDRIDKDRIDYEDNTIHNPFYKDHWKGLKE